jgi:hypothetical protein
MEDECKKGWFIYFDISLYVLKYWGRKVARLFVLNPYK